MAGFSHEQIAAMAATGGAILAKVTDYLLSRRKTETDHETTLIKSLMDRVGVLEKEAREERELCQKRIDALQVKIDTLHEENATYRAGQKEKGR